MAADEESPSASAAAPGADAAAGVPPEDPDEGGEEASPAKEDASDDGVRNINSHYGHRIGFLSTLSLTLNAGLMVYAHVGLSAVILSSRDPAITAGANDNANAADDNGVGGGGAAGATDDAGGGGKCDSDDVALWIAQGGESGRAERSNFCSRKYGAPPCFVDAECIEGCFREEFGYSAECATCFGVIPGCSIASGCMAAWCVVVSSYREGRTVRSPLAAVVRSHFARGLETTGRYDASRVRGEMK